MFDPTKAGPGVSKNEPEKTAFFRFFDLYFRKFFKLIIANLLYVLVSLPIVTRGLAEAGLTFVTRNYVREKHVFLPADFFDTIKKNWKAALGVGLLDVVVSVLLAYDLWFFGGNLLHAEEFSVMTMLMTAAVMMVCILVTFARYYVYIQMITFRLTVKQVLKNSLLLAFAGLKRNIVVSLLLLIVYAGLVCIALFTPIEIAIILCGAIYLFLLPAFRSFLIQFTVFPVIHKTIIEPYYREHPEEDVDRRHDLNLTVEGQKTDPEEVIFEDTGKSDTVSVEREEANIPKQYSADEMRRAKRLTKDGDNRDDDGTI